jgi:hypothetical protein
VIVSRVVPLPSTRPAVARTLLLTIETRPPDPSSLKQCGMLVIPSKFIPVELILQFAYPMIF